VKKIVTFALTLYLISGIITISAQNQLNTDSLFEEAKVYAESKDYDKAEGICLKILTIKEDGDVRFYLGLLYSWDKKYDDARRELKKVYEERPNSEEVIIARTNNELWSGNPLTALEIINKALADKPDNEDFLYLKAKALYDLKRYDEAITVLETLLKINPNNKKAKDLLNRIKVAKTKNRITAFYSNDFFDNDPPWYWAYLQYARKIPIGTVIGRVNYARRNGINDFQYEADAYLTTGKSSHIYLNAGVSHGKLFPDYRCGFEFFQILPKKFEASLGFRELWYSSTNVTIFTGSIGKYWKEYWFSFRPYLTIARDKTFFTYLFQARRFFNDDRENYLGMMYVHGSSPDDVTKSFDNGKLFGLSSDKFKVTYNHRFAVYWIYQVAAAYEWEEYYTSMLRNKYTIELTLERLF
jgi:YaiO family outer membrane protein